MEMLVQCQSYLKMSTRMTNKQMNIQNVEDIVSVSIKVRGLYIDITLHFVKNIQVNFGDNFGDNFWDNLSDNFGNKLS